MRHVKVCKGACYYKATREKLPEKTQYTHFIRIKVGNDAHVATVTTFKYGLTRQEA